MPESNLHTHAISLDTYFIQLERKLKNQFYIHYSSLTFCKLLVHPIDSLSVNYHLVQNRLKIDVTPIIVYVGYSHLLARAKVSQGNSE